jgi:Na+-driven multidrug efflux pump
VAVFTNDAAVKLAAGATLPLVCALFPLDAAASIMDGCLLAAQQHDYLAAVQIVGSVAQFAALSWLVSNGQVNVMTVWGVLKLLTVFRTVGGVHANFLSPRSAYATRKAA